MDLVLQFDLLISQFEFTKGPVQGHWMALQRGHALKKLCTQYTASSPPDLPLGLSDPTPQRPDPPPRSVDHLPAERKLARSRSGPRDEQRE